MAHLDVVPVDADSPWQHDAFGAEIHDGQIWGRGTLDDKGCVAAICSAVERHLAASTVRRPDVAFRSATTRRCSAPLPSRPSPSSGAAGSSRGS